MFQGSKVALSSWLLGAVAAGALIISNEVPTNLEVISKLQDELKDLRAEEQTIWARADKDSAGRPTAEQLKRLDEIKNRVKEVQDLYNRRMEAQEHSDFIDQGTGRKVKDDANGRGPDGKKNEPSIIDRDDVQRHGFSSFGHYAMAVVEASKPNATIDGRLRYWNTETTFQKVATGEDGGYAIPPAFMRDIYQKLKGPEALLARCNNMTSDSDVAHMLVNEEQPGITAGGVKAYWLAEGADMTRSRAKLKNKMMELHEIGVLVFASNKSLRNASLLGSLLKTEAPKAITHEVNSAIVAGDGVGKPRGILNSPSKITVAKEAGPQTADTIVYQNIVKMWNRLSADLRSDAIWLINQECEPQLELMEFPTTTGATAVPAYLPAGGAADTPYARLKGRPVLPVKPCKILGDEGDIILTNLQTYLALTAGGIEEDTSAHLAFDQNLQAFRFMFSIYGDSLWQAPEQPQNGTTTYSNIVTLQAR